MLGGGLGRFRGRGRVLETAELSLQLRDARRRRLVRDEKGRFDPALAAVGQPHVRHVRIALEDLDGRAADEILERLLARIGRGIQAAPPAVRDVDGVCASAAGPHAEREAEKSLLTHPISPT